MRPTLPPTLGDIEALALSARDALPPVFRAQLENLLIRVEDFAPDALLTELGIEDAYELTGLYEGVALTERSVMDTDPRPNMIWLFRQPILAEWLERGDIALADLVGHVLIHEIAHHLGWSDDDIAAIDPWWE